MLRQDDLDLAVERGLISAEQARGLTGIAAERHKARAFAVGREERFRLLGGFNDFFIALGVLLLGIGLSFTLMALADVAPRGGERSASLVFFSMCGMVAAAMWALAEWLTGRLQLTAPSIVVAVFWTLSAALAGTALYVLTVSLLFEPELFDGRRMHSYFTRSLVANALFIVIGLAAVAAAAAHYLRFRLPFTLFLISLSILATVFLGGLMAMPRPSDQFVFAASLLVGLAVFLAAMRYDLRDPERLSRAADCAFWLHLAAAPMIVHPLASSLIQHPFFGTAMRGAMAAPVAGTTLVSVVALTLVLAAVALVIDRRALLVAGLGYLGAAVTFAITKAGAAPGISAMATLLFLGITIIVLGTGWRGLRAALMSALPDFPLKSRLPPYIGAS